LDIQRNPTRAVRIGSITIGDGHPIAVQSMTATHTQNVEATAAQANALHEAGADVVHGRGVDVCQDSRQVAEVDHEARLVRLTLRG